MKMAKPEFGAYDHFVVKNSIKAICYNFTCLPLFALRATQEETWPNICRMVGRSKNEYFCERMAVQ